METVTEQYEEATNKVYMRSSYAAQMGAIASAILVLAEAVRYHADVTAPILPEKNTGEIPKFGLQRMDGSQND